MSDVEGAATGKSRGKPGRVGRRGPRPIGFTALVLALLGGFGAAVAAGGCTPDAAPGPAAAAERASGPAPPARTASLPVGPPPPPDLSDAYRRAGRVPPLSSLLVSQAGDRLGESYWAGASAGRPINVKSASKSILSLLVGIAIEEGHVRSVDQPIREFLGDRYRGLGDPRKRLVTVGHLLSMQAGLATTSFDTYGAWASSGDWIGFALRRPVECLPGRCWEYSTGNYHLLSAILARATGVDTRTWARRELLGPLGIPARPWDRGPDGYYLGGNNMSFTPAELLRIGEMLLNEGRWEGEQVVPERWIRRSWTPRVTSSYNGNEYGYGWWSRTLAGERLWYAWGYGGQYLFLAPELELAVVATTAPGRERGSFDADRAIFRILRDEILPEVRRSTPERGADPPPPWRRR